MPPRPHHRERARPRAAKEGPRSRAHHRGSQGRGRRRTRRGIDVRYQATAEDVIAYLREQQVTLTYDPAARTLHAGTGNAATTITLKAS